MGGDADTRLTLGRSVQLSALGAFRWWLTVECCPPLRGLIARRFENGSAWGGAGEREAMRRLVGREYEMRAGERHRDCI